MDLDDESSGSESDDYKPNFVNPLAKKAEVEKENPEDEWSDESDQSVKGKKNKKVLGKRKRKTNPDDVVDFFKDEVFEEVRADDPATKAEDGYESMDSDEIAEYRVLAKKMLRKKDRNQIILDSYNRYSFHEQND